MSETIFSFAFHGGAGVIPQGAIDSDAYYASLKNITTQTFEYAERNLNNSNIQAVDIVEYGVKLLENDPYYNAGKGAVFATNGQHEMEASIMNGQTLQCGAVSMIKNYKNPISIAKLIMEKTQHVFMTGEGAENLAKEYNFENVENNSYFSTQKRLDQLHAAQKANGVFVDHDLPERSITSESETLNTQCNAANTAATTTSSNSPTAITTTHSTIDLNLADTDTGTVGCVCYYKGSVAAATSTGGMTNKLSGRVGDTPIVGAGTYANNQTCAVSATGMYDTEFVLYAGYYTTVYIKMYTVIYFILYTTILYYTIYLKYSIQYYYYIHILYYILQLITLYPYCRERRAVHPFCMCI